MDRRAYGARIMNVGTLVQARMASVRLPGKTLLPALGKPMLQYLLERLERMKGPARRVVVATSDDPSDDPIAAFCRERGAECFRGPLEDVAARFGGAVERCGFDAFVRISGDSPLFHPGLADEAAAALISEGRDIVTNAIERTYPKGQSVEALRSDVFLDGLKRMTEPDEREHVTPYFYRNRERYNLRVLKREPARDRLQMSVDSPEDLAAFEAVLRGMDRPHWEYSLEETIGRMEAVRA